MANAYQQYLWIAVCGGICGMLYAFLIGANDVANAFASSVSSKSLTLKQAVICAAIFEFCGALFLGASVTSTIRSKIIDIDLYTDQPDVLMFGMFTSMFSASIMLWLATYFGLPVSTTHDMVGSIMGFSIAAKGFDSVEWDVAKKLFLSWILSPLIAGTGGFIFFAFVKYVVMKSVNPFQRAYYTFPLVLTIGIGIDLFYTLYKAGNNLKALEDLSVAIALPASFGVGLLCGLIWIFGVGPLVEKRIVNAREERITNSLQDAVNRKSTLHTEIDPTMMHENEGDLDGGSAPGNDPEAAQQEKVEHIPSQEIVVSEAEEPMEGIRKFTMTFSDMVNMFGESTYKQDLHAQSMSENTRAAKIWDHGEEYDKDAEHLFNFIQVFTACLNSFAHGANDVANAIAPLSAVLYIFHYGTIESKTGVQKWLLAAGGGCIVLGLLLYGYRVMKSLGYKLTKLSPSRGASAELAASLTVVTASFLGIPVSSTQCIVGAISGVGLVNGHKNVQWFFLLRVMLGWGVMFFLAVLLSAGIFSFAAFSPDL
ncbi:phosphate transporter family protein [Nitzschia inconspicua]|uniref:Phosphate transporter n=1 Tax=Nitzschia inconspicua TaxID=303405 RepID=A0A9K3KEN8_9STRA|nr:phosphate transporter family protein [Nitzschia inconspicua]